MTTAGEQRSVRDDLQRGRSEAAALGASVGEVTQELRALAQAEMDLAKAEVSDSISATIRGAIFGVAAAIFALMLLTFLGHTLAAVLVELDLDVWLAYLITTLVFGIVAGILGYLAMNNFKQVSVVPKRTIRSLQEDVTWAREQTRRNAG